MVSGVLIPDLWRSRYSTHKRNFVVQTAVQNTVGPITCGVLCRKCGEMLWRNHILGWVLPFLIETVLGCVENSLFIRLSSEIWGSWSVCHEDLILPKLALPWSINISASTLERLRMSCHADWNASCHTLNVRTFGLHFYCLHHKSSFSDRLNEFHLHSYRRDCQDTCRDFRSFAISAKSIYPIKATSKTLVLEMWCVSSMSNWDR